MEGSSVEAETTQVQEASEGGTHGKVHATLGRYAKAEQPARRKWARGRSMEGKGEGGGAFVYLVAEKMSSNFFLSTAPSSRGQLLSSRWTKMTFSRMAWGVELGGGEPRNQGGMGLEFWQLPRG